MVWLLPLFIEPLTKKNTNNHSIMKKGFVKLYREYDERKWASDPVTLSTFIHCLWMARYEEGIYNGKIIPRGSFMISISKFAEKIGASQKAIRGAIERLTKDKVLVTRGANDGTMITICNYDSYYVSEESIGQTMGEQRASVGTNDGIKDGQTKGQQYKKEYKEEEQEEYIIPPTPKGEEQTSLFGDEGNDDEKKSKRFVKPTIEEIDAYCRERNNTIDAESFFNFYESKGWLVGKSPMKDWKAAVRTWEKSRQTTLLSSAASPASKKYDQYGNLIKETTWQ